VSPTGAKPEACLNCGAALGGPYCSQCGQKVEEPLPRVHELVAEAADEFLKFDSKLLRSVWTLVRYPGQLSLEFAHGRRQAYLSPLKLYFSASFLTLFFMGSLKSYDLVSMGLKVDPDTPRTTRAAIEGMRFYFEHSAVISILLLPLCSFALQVLFHKERSRFLFHLVTTLHNWSGSSFLFLPVYLPIGVYQFRSPSEGVSMTFGLGYGLLIWVYQALAFRRIYGSSWFASFVKSGLTLVWLYILFVVTFIALMILFILPAFRS
jgi:hypothetical protein